MIGATLAPLRRPLFRTIWFANVASSLGTMIQSVGAAWLMTSLSHSAKMVALVQSSTTLPIMLLALFAGAIADMYDRRTIMLVSQCLMLAASVVLATLAALGVLTPWLLLALTLCIGVGTALNAPAWQASIREQVPRHELPAAIVLNSIGFNLARSIGPAFGGLLLAAAGPTANFAANAVSYIALIIVLLRWRVPPVARHSQPLMASIRSGLQYSWSVQPVRSIMLRSLVFGLLAAGLWALMPLIARDILHGRPLDYGLLLGLFGIGSIAGAFIAIRARQRFTNELVFTTANAGFAVATAGLALSHDLYVSLAWSMLAGSCWVAALSTINIAIQTLVPQQIVGRCLAHYYMAAFGGLALGSYTWGAAADQHGIAAALLSSAGLLAATTILGRWAPLPGSAGSGEWD